ncbi:hypothetical protein [Streptomyces sp. NPDC059271]|uniref:hypothetical protein n=1 Tax=Streptomyces sp. NPDC059271 TaxID=3346799 RepID=UPI00369C152F
MADTDLIALDGFLDEEIVPGDAHGSIARFRLVVSPSDELADEMILPCTATDPRLTRAVLTELQPGDTLRVTGVLRLPRAPGEPTWLAVTGISVLATAPQLTDPAAPATTVIEQYGPYLCVFDADTAEVEAFTQDGAWVGTVPEPSGLSNLFAAFEERQATGGE